MIRVLCSGKKGFKCGPDWLCARGPLDRACLTEIASRKFSLDGVHGFIEC